MMIDPLKPTADLRHSGTAFQPSARRGRWMVIALLAVLFCLILGIWYVWTTHKSSTLATLEPRKTGLFQNFRNLIFHSDNIMEGQGADRINILLLGIGGSGHDGPYLSDTNIIASIKPSTNEVSLISIPRDLGVEIPDRGWRKINSADAFGEADHPGAGGDYARQIFEKTFNLAIPYYVRVDFHAFEDIVNQVGGVAVDVPRTFTDTSYPDENNGYQTIHFDAGTQTMNGTAALEYARSRHGNNGEDSDFARARRQQLIIESLKNKLFSASTLTSPSTLEGIYTSLASHITTNLDVTQLLYLSSIAQDLKMTHTLVLDNSTSGYLVERIDEVSGAYMLLPRTGSFDTINSAISQIFDVASSSPTAATITTLTPSQMVSSSVKLEVQNGTWRAGLAARIRDHLKTEGYNVIDVGNSLQRPIDTTQMVVLHPDAVPNKVLSALAAEFKVTPTKKLPPWLEHDYDNSSTLENESGAKYNTDADILLILGSTTVE